jgi:hypothetical protein
VFASIQTALEADFKSRRIAAGLNFSEDQLAFENTETPASDLFEEWLRYTIQFGDGVSTQIGGRGYRYWGIVMVQFFVKKGIGVARGVELADAVALMYREKVLFGCLFGVPTLVKVPDKSEWFHVQVSAPFYFNEVLP